MGFAGDTFNTTWYVRALTGTDTEVAYLTAVGADNVSARMLEFMQSAGIDTSHIVRLAERTVGLYIIHLQDGERSFSYWRNNSAARQIAHHLPNVSRYVQPNDVFHFSGISIAILTDEDRQGLLDFLARAKDAGAVISFDPNIRPALWNNDKDIATWLAKSAALSDLAFPSFDEEASRFAESDLAAVAKRYLDWGSKQVIVKNGGKGGVIARSANDLVGFDPVAAPLLIDTTAAGDSFDAGFLVEYMKGRPLEKCAAAGALLASKVIGRHGALVPV
jgi:2-dehydro-3-deoxygluconokinase